MNQVKTLPEHIQAVEISTPGGPDVLTPVSRPMPVPDSNEVPIQVAAAGVNRPDAMQRAGQILGTSIIYL